MLEKFCQFNICKSKVDTPTFYIRSIAAGLDLSVALSQVLWKALLDQFRSQKMWARVKASLDVPTPVGGQESPVPDPSVP